MIECIWTLSTEDSEKKNTLTISPSSGDFVLLNAAVVLSQLT